MKIPVPTEDHEQRVFILWLQQLGIMYFAVPNGGLRNKRTAARLKLLGAIPGIPDIVIVDSPPLSSNIRVVSVAVEMKRREGGELSRAQKEIHEAMRKRGWIIIVGYGAKDAMDKMRQLGF